MADVVAMPDGIVARQFHAVREKWPYSMLTAYADGQAVLSVPGVRLHNPNLWSMATATVAAILPAGYPQAAPDLFFYGTELSLSHGGFPRNVVDDARLPGFHRFVNKPKFWHPNDATLTMLVNFMRLSLSNLAGADKT